MAKPEEFTIQIEPDGRIIMKADGLQESSYRRIIELLEETIGPVREISLEPGEPPSRHIHPTTEDGSTESTSIEFGQKE